MKKFRSISFILAMLAGLLPAGVFAQEADDDERVIASASAWPVRFDSGDASYVVYQPQFDKWDDNRLEGRSAVAVTRAGADLPEFGVVWLSAQTRAGAGTVTIRDLSITKADFPTDSGGSGDHVAAMRRQLGAKSWQVAQERLQNDLEIDKAASRSSAQPVKNDVPQILFSQEPAILVPIDGVPAMRDVPGTGLDRIVNTRALMLFDPVLTQYYLYVADHWMQAQKLEGPWNRVANAPVQLEQAKEVAVKDNQVDLLVPDEDEGPVPESPAIRVSTTPTELLQTEGPPQYSPVADTRLLYVTNSPNRIFLDTATQAHYVLISGRWFRTRNLGPDSWEYVSAVSLPGDFARIPSTHPAGSVRAAVAGTPQARGAAIENTIPQVATVTRSAAGLNVTYDGNPSFRPIDGTSLQQAVNAPIPVIRVGENAFDALDNGVWFAASSPFGPWSVAASVPAVVYSIPRNSPLHYVTYVRIYDATPDVVYVGYTPGYVGSYVSSDYVVVYGTGWHYRPWIGSVWYSAPLTWGFGFSFVHTWWRPWRPHYAVWVPPAPCFRPAWGPWHYRPVYRGGVTVVNNVTINRVNVRQANLSNIYSRWDGKAVVVNRNVQPRPQHAGAPPVRMPGRRTDYAARSGGFDGARSRNEPPSIQGLNRRADRADEGTRQRRDADRGPQQRPQAGVQPRLRDDGRQGRQDRLNAIEPDRRAVRPDDRGNVIPDRRETARPERRDTMPQGRGETRERRDFSRQERRDFGGRPQSQALPRAQSMARPPAAPQVQSMPRPQAMPQRAPESSATAPQAQPRAERHMERRSTHSEGRQRGDGGGGVIRPAARGGDWRR